MGSISRATVSTADIDNLPDSDFAYIEPGGTKDGSGKTVPRSKRHFPIQDKAHADNAAARIAQGAEFGSLALPKVKAAQKRFGTKAVTASRSAPLIFHRSFPLMDIQIQRNGDGRTVEAYAAVFHQEAEIRDGQGHYLEVIDPHAFDRAIGSTRPSASRSGWGVSVFFNHGKDLYGNAAAEFTKPVGVPIDIRAEPKGLVTVTRYSHTPLADDVLTLIRDGAITGQSFTGGVQRSEPEQRMYKASINGALPKVMRLQLGLLEYGPTPMPAYEGAGILSVRNLQSSPETGLDQEPATTPAGGSTDDLPDRLSARTKREVIRLNRALKVDPNVPIDRDP